ncbi:TIGR01244 family protein [Kordiimonas sediminis]|uniref:TIGR01244 family protein n=1 Tax=Kordiimonas sediminis TaxID=1735581 RepID=A0A919AJB5_9PROT|nr:TIGR01244 family sulfur transferase [Kordiimonas sediminis]GHF12201.1 TIGR01244 family protein [Kordiimonas sediminis]
MSQFRKVTDTISVSPQLGPADVQHAAELGFKTIICNRPDGEEAGQPDSATIAKAAAEAGLAWHYVPMAGGNLTPDLISETANILASAETPILAYCRSGTRSCNLWAMGSAVNGTGNPEELVAMGGAAGYDLSGIQGLLAQLQNSGQ